MEMEIEIVIGDLLVYARAALILDQEDVLKRILRVRKHWRLNPIPRAEFSRWLNEFKPDLSVTPEAEELRINAVERFETDKMHGNISNFETTLMDRDLARMRDVDFELEYSMRSLNLIPTFKDFILKAIVCNSVSEEDYPNLPQHVDYKYEKWLFEDALFNEELRNYYPEGRPRKNIKRDRQWYWMWKRESKKGAGIYNRILEEWNKDNLEEYIEDINIIQQGVVSYQKFLKSMKL